MQYSVKQSTIEQIFNVFATEKPDGQPPQQPQKEPVTDALRTEEVVLPIDPKPHQLRKTLSISRKSLGNKIYRTLSVDNQVDNIFK